jgi:ABC-type transport system involved in multi-copper enzyme maturation permease subunit
MMFWKALFWKSWMECRFRALLTGLVVAIYLLLGVFPLADYKGSLTGWDWYSKFVTVFGAVVAIMFAGSGINSQTSWGLVRGYHPSMYFLLSLPVSRRQALAARAATGMVLTFLYVLVSVGFYALAMHISPGTAVSSIFFITLAAFSMFGLATFLSTFFDEMVTSSLAIGAVGGMFGGWAALDWTKVKLDPMEIISGQQMAQTGYVNWVAIILCVAAGVLFLLAAVWVVERKEY